MKKWLKRLLIFLAALILIFAVYFYWTVRDRHPGYHVDLSVKNEQAENFRVGFSAKSITPEVHDKWTDVDNNAKYEPKKGDTYTDGNGNGKFDPVWIAGFGNKRAANGIHDELWARTVVFDDGQSRIAITSIDAIGFMSDYIIDVKNRVSEEAGITYSVISSTHTHESPDLIGMWGGSFLKSGVDPEYLDLVIRQTAASIDEAAQNLQPAKLKLAINEHDAAPTIKDTRRPIVLDEGLRMMQAISTETGKTLGTLVAWANHPETLWSDNLLITSDFPHYVREGFEKGVYSGDSLIIGGLGGTTVYINGAIGGLMTTHPSLTVKDPFTGVEYKEPSYEKAKAQSDLLAYLGLKALDSSDYYVEQPGISIRAKSIQLEFQNPLYRLGAVLGVLDRGMTGWMKVRSEVSAFSIGPAHFVTFPGELYPEILNGGIETPEGQDFDLDPIEIPPIRSQMKGDFNFMIGCANDMIGYIVPKSQWDEKEPYTYDPNDSPYGEENSLGPETAPVLHSEVSSLLEELYNE